MKFRHFFPNTGFQSSEFVIHTFLILTLTPPMGNGLPILNFDDFPYLPALCLEVQMRMSIIQTSDAPLLPCVSWDICEHGKNWEKFPTFSDHITT